MAVGPGGGVCIWVVVGAGGCVGIGVSVLDGGCVSVREVIEDKSIVAFQNKSCVLMLTVFNYFISYP